VDREESYRWLKFGYIKEETVAAQVQALGTYFFTKKKILKTFKLNADYVKNTQRI
jgi:hypothetical protein